MNKDESLEINCMIEKLIQAEMSDTIAIMYKDFFAGRKFEHVQEAIGLVYTSGALTEFIQYKRFPSPDIFSATLSNIVNRENKPKPPPEPPNKSPWALICIYIALVQIDARQPYPPKSPKAWASVILDEWNKSNREYSLLLDTLREGCQESNNLNVKNYIENIIIEIGNLKGD